MKTKIALSLVAAAVAMLSQGAFAQDKSRAEVKEETKAAVKAGQTKAGEGSPTAPAAKSEKARADVKAETKTAVKAGETKAGEGKPAEKAPKGEKARADVKADTKKAVKEGTTLPAGEAAPKK
ncbi:MAG: DUF4148 domain-containing protein [Burkholderiaceae bacterium]|nr:DUF4148 domain-containing protein [Burkholderiaceae bacterium]